MNLALPKCPFLAIHFSIYKAIHFMAFFDITISPLEGNFF